MKLKVVSDGTVNGTKVSNAETGELVGGVQRILLEFTAGQAFASGSIVTAQQEFVVQGDFATQGEIVHKFLAWAGERMGEATHVGMVEKSVFLNIVQLANEYAARR